MQSISPLNRLTTMRHLQLHKTLLLWVGLLALGISGCTAQHQPQNLTMAEPTAYDPQKHSLATVGAGCFWCIEAVYEYLDGIISVTSGYMGGKVENPTYEAVCSGTTGHAEVVQIVFDPEKITYETILDWFWDMHDPTTLNRQGADIGTQYRSAIFYHDEAQRTAAETSLKQAQGSFAKPIVTEITPVETFYPAEAYHQNYYARNPSAGYCQFVIRPKLEKLDLE